MSSDLGLLLDDVKNDIEFFFGLGPGLPIRAQVVFIEKFLRLRIAAANRFFALRCFFHIRVLKPLLLMATCQVA